MSRHLLVRFAERYSICLTLLKELRLLLQEDGGCSVNVIHESKNQAHTGSGDIDGTPSSFGLILAVLNPSFLLFRKDD